MSTPSLVNLAAQTITNPAQTARDLLALQPKREALWLGFFLSVVLSSLLQLSIAELLPVPAGEPVPQSESVVLILARFAGGTMLSAITFLMFGRLLGGVGTFDDIFLLTIWLQYLQILGMVLTLVALIVLPFLIVMFTIAFAIIGLYVLLHFLKEAHKFGSLWQSFGVFLLSALVAVPFVLALAPSGPV